MNKKYNSAALNEFQRQRMANRILVGFLCVISGCSSESETPRVRLANNTGGTNADSLVERMPDEGSDVRKESSPAASPSPAESSPTGSLPSDGPPPHAAERLLT